MEMYSAGAVAKATGTPLPTIQRYKQQGHVQLQACDVTSNGSGEKCGYSLRRVFQIALITELNRIGIPPSRAADAALAFSDRGDRGRAVGEPYPLGQTVLLGLPGGVNKVINIPPDLTIGDVLSNDSAAFIIDVGNVVAKVLSKLDSQ
ncbi:hypothetical protein QA633_40025 [Bradyrhizobium barranii]|uniref:hypothetical protein n=1 Tax=Bradyrhizobium barranii TaxID=2992140 RepID=UPI0024AF0C8A|nr:hypothetical protein [Bradyrhizobium barranii]WFT94380.1 hypothetical protein QA633_40025 [Bradyrhizobium barranii]